jgi:hypothetical protein
MSKTILAAALLAVALPAFAQAAAPAIDPRSVTVLAAVRSAMFHRPLSSVTSLHLAGTQITSGLHATFQEWDDLRGQRWVQAQVGGALTGTNGWDGHNAWVQDGTGLFHVDAGASTRLQSIDQAYLDTFAFLAPNAGGGNVSYGGQKTDKGRSYDILNVTPANGSPFAIWIDAHTHLVAKETGTIGLISATTNLSGYHTSHGVTFPHSLVSVTSDGNSQAVSLSAVGVNQNVRARMKVPASNVRDASIAGGTTTVPIQIINNHIYVRGLLDGKGPFTFILDTGGAFIISPEVAAALKSGATGSAQIGGVGNATEAAGFTHIDALQIGDATVRNQYSLVLPIDKGFGVAEGLHIDGMIGYEFVARFLTTIDYAASTMTLAGLPAAPAIAPNATAVPFFFNGTIPIVPIQIDGIHANGEFDTGSRGSLTLTSPFVAANPTLAADATTADGVAGFGIGGPSFAKLGRATEVKIGPFSFTHPTVAFVTQTQGGFADPLAPQNIGGDIWKRFTVTFDYPHSQVLLAPNASFGSAFVYDRSGLFLIDTGGAHVVLSARAGTPGAAAGLTKGDAILSVDGASAATMTLAQLRTTFMGPVGTVVRLRVKSAAGERNVDLTLRDYV